MSIEHQDERALVWSGDCVELMRELPDKCMDSVVTDPPYALEFMGKGWDKFTPLDFEAWCAVWATECFRLLKPGGHLLAFGGTRTFHRLAAGIEDAGFEIRDSIAWLYGSGFPKSHNLKGEFEGWGTALKPAFEPVVVARKPPVGTVAANVLTYGTGALNIDASRIEIDVADPVHKASWTHAASDTRPGTAGFLSGTQVVGEKQQANVHALGRWPANVILDESQAAALDEQSGTLTSGKMQPTHTTAARVVYGQNAEGGYTTSETYGDTGGASRFFYQAKASARERPKVEGNDAHPTVKPLALMRYLVRLVTPPGGQVLDPFSGSGTTLEACLLEGLRCMAMERETAYVPLILARIHRNDLEP